MQRQRQSAAHLRVIVKHSHGHLFLSSDIIMEIPTQAKTIPMNSDEVKARLQHIESDASESDATLQIYGLPMGNILNTEPISILKQCI